MTFLRTHEPEELPEATTFHSAAHGGLDEPMMAHLTLLSLREKGFCMSGDGADQRSTDPRMKAVDPARPPIERLSRFLERLAGTAFFGKVVVSFQNGKVADVRIEQTKKLEEL